MLRKRTKPRDKGKAAGTRSKVRKGPARDEKHLARVRMGSCAICGVIALSGDNWWKLPALLNEAHHVRSLAPRSMGKRVSDYLTISLCNQHHRELHKGKEEAFWKAYRRDPARIISNFSEEGRQAIAELTRSHN